jgi:hypothetical protein
MIRNIVLVKFRPGTTQTQIDAVTSAVRAMEIAGLISLSFGTDLGLREGNVSFAAVFDFEDEAAYRAYDRDEEHNRIRRELLAPIAERAERCQYRL